MISLSDVPPMLPQEIADSLNENHVGDDDDNDNNENTNVNDFSWELFWSRLVAIRKKAKARALKILCFIFLPTILICAFMLFWIGHDQDMDGFIVFLAIFFYIFVLCAVLWLLNEFVLMRPWNELRAACAEANESSLSANGWVLQVEYNSSLSPFSDINKVRAFYLYVLRKCDEEVSSDGAFTFRNGYCRVLLNGNVSGKTPDLLQYGEKLPPVTGSSSDTLLLRRWKIFWENLHETSQREQRMRKQVFASYMVVMGVIHFPIIERSSGLLRWIFLAVVCLPGITTLMHRRVYSSALEMTALGGLYMERRRVIELIHHGRTWLYMYRTTTADTIPSSSQPE